MKTKQGRFQVTGILNKNISVKNILRIFSALPSPERVQPLNLYVSKDQYLIWKVIDFNAYFSFLLNALGFKVNSRPTWRKLVSLIFIQNSLFFRQKVWRANNEKNVHLKFLIYFTNNFFNNIFLFLNLFKILTDKIILCRNKMRMTSINNRNFEVISERMLNN